MNKTLSVGHLICRPWPLLAAALFAVSLAASAAPEIFVFDNGVGRGAWTPEQQASTLKALGYNGISYDYTNTKDLAEWLKACKASGVKLTALYIYTHLDKPERYDPGIKEAIKMLKGTDTIIWMTLATPKPDGGHDAEAASTIRDIAGQAAEQGLRVAIYPHRGFYISTAMEALRILKLAAQTNVGITINLCHEYSMGQGDKLDETIKAAAPYCTLVSINGVDTAAKNYIMRLDQGDFDLAGYMRKLRDAGYHGPVGLQCYQVHGDLKENLKADMAAWKRISGQ